MGRAPCCDKANVKKGPWSPEEDIKLKEFIEKYGTGGNWIALPQKAGLKRCGKSCRLRWLNYLRPNIKHGEFSDYEDRIICGLFQSIGSRWSIIAAQLPGRTDNDIKNYWNTKLKKKLMGNINFPSSQMKLIPPPLIPSLSQTVSTPPLTFKCSSPNTLFYPPIIRSPSTGLDQPISPSIPSNHLNNYSTSTITSFTQSQESLVGPIHHYQGKDNLPTFGGEPSCSSSDGSCSNQVSYGKDIKHENRNLDMLDFGLGCNIGWSSTRQRPIGLWGETPLEYDLEEIKQLVSTNGCNNYIDEAKTVGRVMYY